VVSIRRSARGTMAAILSRSTGKSAGPAGLQMTVQPRQVDLQRGQALPQLVMQLPGEGGAFLLADMLDAGRQRAILLVRGAKFRLGPLALRDVFDEANDELWFAGGIAADRARQVGADCLAVISYIPFLKLRIGRTLLQRLLKGPTFNVPPLPDE